MKKTTTKPISLNDEQQAVVNAGPGYWQVMAGPGSGKTATLVSRFARLLSEGVDPSRILSLSFTATAAKNLRERVESQAGKLQFKPGSGSVTFHSLSLTFAQEERDAYPFKLAEFPLATEPIANKLSGDAGRKYELDPRHLRPYISLQKRNRVKPASAIKEAEASGKAAQIKLALAYKNYDARLADAGVLDFDSLIQFMVEILEKRPDIRDRWSPLYIMCDEAQDCSQIEWDLLRLLSAKHGNLLCVGDVGQNLYSFRGSNAAIFRDMKELFPGCQTFLLGCNYRSTPEIVDFIRPYSATPELAQKFHTPNPSGPIPIIQGFSDSADEAVWVVNRIKEQLCATT